MYDGRFSRNFKFDDADDNEEISFLEFIRALLRAIAEERTTDTIFAEITGVADSLEGGFTLD
jgi:hypothetical protein